MREVLDWNQRAPLGDAILAAVAEEAEALAAVSPAGKLARLQVPVFIIHGDGDPIIPSSESRWLAHELPEAARARVVITPVLRHAELPNPPSPGDYVDIIDFMAAILRAAQAPPPLRL